MPYYKRKPFAALAPPPNLKPDEEVFFLKLTGEIFRDYDEYFTRVILCNSLVWSCALTGKANLTFQEAIESERSAKRQLNGFPRPLKKALFYLTFLTRRGKFTDVVEDVLTYARDRYFKGEEVLSVIGNMWCPSKVIRIITPTAAEMENYKEDQIKRGLYEKNDYLRDDSWGPSPDLFRYEVQEIDAEDKTPVSEETYILEALDVKREKSVLTRDKCRNLLKLATDFVEEKGLVLLRINVINSYGLVKLKYDDLFVGKVPIFEESPLPVKTPVSKSSKPKTDEKSRKESSEKKTKSNEGKDKRKSESSKKPAQATNSKKSAKPEPKQPKPKKEKQLTPEELKQIELEKKQKEREELKAQKKLIVDFKKLWFKPKEDLEVEDLKDLPTPDPISCKIPNNLFGDFIMVLEFMNCYSSTLKVRDCFTQGITFDILERAVTKGEVAGPFSEILQLIIKTIFRLQQGENAEITGEETQTVDFDDVNEMDGDCTAREAVQQATAYSTWSMMYQNTPLHKLGVDPLTISEVIRLHLLASGAKPSEKDVKWRNQQRGGYTETDDPGLQLRLEEPQILKTLSSGTVFDLTIRERLKLLVCLINQVTTYVVTRDVMEDSYDQYKTAKANLRTLQAAEKKKDAEDTWWRQKLHTERLVPDMSQYKAEKQTAGDSQQDDESGLAKEAKKGSKKDKSSATLEEKSSKPPLTDEQMEYQINKKEKEIARRKQDFYWKESELQDQILKHDRKLGLHPLGRDRAYRRYWIFPSVAGVFVENDDEYVGDCLSSPTPYIGNVNFEDMKFVKETFDKYQQIDREGGSDKENSIVNSPSNKSAKKKGAKSGVKKDVIERPSIFGICNGDRDSCPVHCTYLPKSKWSFFWNPEDIDTLIENLTPRGIREKDLRAALVEEKIGIKEYLNKCPVLKLNREGKYPEHLTNAPEKRPQRSGQTQKNKPDPNLNYPTGTSIEIILELQLRDLILEAEEKICLGALGSIKVASREVWRKAIEDRGYDPQTAKLTWGDGKFLNVSKRKCVLNGSAAPENSEEGTKSEMSSHTSTSSDTNKEDAPMISPVIKDLACAILQIRQGLEPKFLKRPLGEDDKDKKKKSKEAELPTNIKLPAPTAMERWELSLMSCTSFSQLFVHITTLDNSVEWSRSVLNARCRVCRRKGNPETMLLCDGCNKGHHATCLKPPIEDIPKGDWFCYECKPPEPVPKLRDKKRRLVEDILDELDAESEDEDDSHTGRRGGRRSNETNVDPAEEPCAICNYTGDVMVCNWCSVGYHALCLNPPLNRPPRGTWMCSDCKAGKPIKQKDKKKGRLRRPAPSRRKHDSSDDEAEEDFDDNDDSRNGMEESNDDDGITTEDEDEDTDKSSDEAGEVKIRFGKQRTSGNSAGSSRSKRVYEDDDDYVDSEEERHQGSRGSRRKCASQAAAKIAQVAKRLRSDSKENESSDNSNDSSAFGYGSRKRDHGEGHDSPEFSKRTRLQRMNTNNRVRNNGELDNVLLDKVLSEVMKQNDAWAFLKPVTRQEAPDYHEIVKNPMDLGTIKYKLNSMVYTCNEEFISDLLLVFSNCELYNARDSKIFQDGEKLKTFCERRFSKIGIQISDSP